MFLTGGSEILDYGHVISGSGFRLPSDSNADNQMWYWSNHLDYQVFRKWYALTEFNWYHWMKSGSNGIPGIEGGDLFNFGSTGVAWELPLTERRDVLENRLTVDAILRY